MDTDTKTHLLKLIDFLYNDILSSGGDGDALWYSKYHSVKDILPLVEEYNSKLPFKWDIKGDEKNIYWGIDQEGAIITNDEEVYKKSPPWQQILIKY